MVGQGNMTQTLLINFEFEELNAAVLANAQIYLYKKKHPETKIFVLAPAQFAKFYYHADKLFIFSNEKVKRYSKILEYKPIGLQQKLYRFREKIYALASRFNLCRNFFYKAVFRTPRQNKFYIRSGLEGRLIKKASNLFGGKLSYIRINVYWDLVKMKALRPDLNAWFIDRFSDLYKMISEGAVYQFDNNKKKSAVLKCVLRTRNFKNKAVEHNSKAEVLKPLVECLLKKGVVVENIGVPHMPLDIKHKNYLEYSHNMSIEEEFIYCGLADCVILTAEAGLFTGFAATNLPLVQYDNEWSADHIGIELFGARQKAGLRSLDVRSFLAGKNFDEAAEQIIKFSQQDILSAPCSASTQDIVDLGMVQ